MEIKNFFQKIFVHSKEVHVPAAIQQHFQKKFSDAMNAEWQKMDEVYEVVFYHDEHENIATYQKDGLMLSLKINLILEELPNKIKQVGQKFGELMNAIKIEYNEETQFELIIRDEMLVRYSLLLNEAGELLNKRQL